MSLSKNTLDRSDISTYPIKLKYSASYESSSAVNYGITLNRGINGSFISNDNDFLVYKLAKQLYYNSYLTGSLNNTASAWNDNLQSTAASGTFDNDYRYFPTASGDEITVLAIPRNVFGENISRKSLIISGSTYYLIDDGNGNVIDVNNNNVHVGNILYAQGIVIITNLDYEYALIQTTTTTTTTSTTSTTTTAAPTTTSTTTSTTTAAPTTTSTTTAAPTTTTTSTTTAAPTTTTTSTTTSTTTAAPTTTTTSTTTSTTTPEPTTTTTSTTTSTTTAAPTTTTTSTTTSTTTVAPIVCEDWEILNGAFANTIDYQDCLGNPQQLNLDPSEIIGCFSVNSNAFGVDIPFLGTQPFTFNKCVPTTTTSTTTAAPTTTSTTTAAPTTTSTTTAAPTTTTTSTTTSTTTAAPTTTTTSTTTSTTTVGSTNHFRSATPQINSTNACAQSTPTNIFTSIPDDTMSVGIIFYSDSNLNTTFDGNSQWFKILWKGAIGFDDVYAVQISSLGDVEDFLLCSSITTTTTTTTSTTTTTTTVEPTTTTTSTTTTTTTVEPTTTTTSTTTTTTTIACYEYIATADQTDIDNSDNGTVYFEYIDCDGITQTLPRGTTIPSNPVCARSTGTVYILIGGNQSAAGGSLWSIAGAQCNPGGGGGETP